MEETGHNAPSDFSPNDPKKAVPQENEKSTKVELEIVRYRELLETLRQPLMIWRLLITCLFLVIVVFFGLAMVVMSVKKIYPYSTIKTNIYGATTMGTEDKDVTYWLFNTAEMWANSGISVDEGDVITVRSSGAWHTAIHHLVKQAEDNKELTDKYTGSEGRERREANDAFRARFRFVDDITDGTLLMCIIPEDSVKHSADAQASSNSKFRDYANGISEQQIYEIGKERRDFRITKKGVLHFAVNDIPLTRDNIKTIYKVYIDSLACTFTDIMNGKVDSLKNWVEEWKGDSIKFTPEIVVLDSLLTEAWEKMDKNKKLSYLFGANPETPKRRYMLNNELIYYYNSNFLDAWYVDNIGSLLIVVEKKKKS